MAIEIHIVNTGAIKKNAVGDVVDKNHPTNSIKSVITAQEFVGVLPNSDVPNSANSPTIEEYLKLEAADDFVIQHLDNTTIITYKRTAAGGFA